MATQSGKHDPYAAFRFRNFRLFTIGSMITLMGTQIQSVAIGWEMYQRTGDALAIGLVGLVQAVPMFVLALPAGLIADRYDRRTLIAISIFGATLTSLGLAWLSYVQGPVWLMYLLLMLDATALVLGRPARVAIMPHLVPREAFPNAVMWRSGTWQLSVVLGPALGGFVVAWSVPSAYLIAAASTFLFLLTIARLEYDHVDHTANNRLSTWQSLMTAVQFTWKSRLLLAAVSLDMFAVLLGGAVYLMPIYAADILKVGPRGLGYLNAAPAVGALVMAMIITHRPPMKFAGRNLLWSVAGFGVATIVFGLSTNLWLSLTMLFFTGALDNISVVIRHTIMQMITPDDMRGRVSAINSMFIGASNELGGFESGLLARLTTPIVSVVAGGVGTIVVVTVTALASPRLRRFGSLESVSDETQ